MLLLLACATVETVESNCGPAGAALEIPAMCVDGVCLPAELAEFQDKWGPEDNCAPVACDYACTWGDRSVGFTDGECFHQQQWVTISASYAGTSPAGLGLGVAESCWDATLGARADDGRWWFGEDPYFLIVEVVVDGGVVTDATLSWSVSE